MWQISYREPGAVASNYPPFLSCFLLLGFSRRRGWYGDGLEGWRRRTGCRSVPIASSPCLADDRPASSSRRTDNSIIVISLLCSLSLYANQHGFLPSTQKNSTKSTSVPASQYRTIRPCFTVRHANSTYEYSKVQTKQQFLPRNPLSYQKVPLHATHYKG